MSPIEVDTRLIARLPDDDPVESTVWLAREILGGYMLGACEMDYVLVISGEDSVEEIVIDSDDEDDLEDDWPPTLHETDELPINDHQVASLSNSPYILRHDGVLQRWTRPGYVALQLVTAERNDEPPLKEDCEQFVFKLPVSELSDAAIIRGFSLDNIDQITDTEEILELYDFLEFFKRGIRNMIIEEGTIESTYLSQTPEETLTDELSYELGQGD